MVFFIFHLAKLQNIELICSSFMKPPNPFTKLNGKFSWMTCYKYTWCTEYLFFPTDIDCGISQLDTIFTFSFRFSSCVESYTYTPGEIRDWKKSKRVTTKTDLIPQSIIIQHSNYVHVFTGVFVYVHLLSFCLIYHSSDAKTQKNTHWWKFILQSVLLSGLLVLLLNLLQIVFFVH